MLCIGNNAQGVIGIKLTCAVRVYAPVIRQSNGVPYSSKQCSYDGQRLTVSLAVCCGQYGYTQRFVSVSLAVYCDCVLILKASDSTLNAHV